MDRVSSIDADSFSKRSRSELFTEMERLDERLKRVKEELESRTPTLPRDAVKLILQNMDPRKRLTLRVVCKLWHRAVDEMTNSLSLDHLSAQHFNEHSFLGVSKCFLRFLDLRYVHRGLSNSSPEVLGNIVTLVELKVNFSSVAHLEKLTRLETLFITSFEPHLLHTLPSVTHLRGSPQETESDDEGDVQTCNVERLDLTSLPRNIRQSAQFLSIFPNLLSLRTAMSSYGGQMKATFLNALILKDRIVELQFFVKEKTPRTSALKKVCQSLPNLEVLILGANSGDCDVNPIRKLTKLRELQLRFNAQETLENFTHPSLETLYYHSWVGGSVKHLTNLKRVAWHQVSWNDLPATIEFIQSPAPQHIGVNVSLESLTRIGTSLTTLNSNAAVPGEMFGHFPHLKHLRMDYIAPGAEAFLHLCPLESLHIGFRQNGVFGGGPAAEPEVVDLSALQALVGLRSLVFVQRNGWKISEASIFGHLPLLSTLVLHACDLDSATAEAIAEAVPNLRCFAFPNCPNVNQRRILNGSNRVRRVEIQMLPESDYLPQEARTVILNNNDPFP